MHLLEGSAEFLTLPEAAAIVRAPLASVRYWAASGRLVTFRPGRRVLVGRADLDAFIALSRRGGGS